MKQIRQIICKRVQNINQLRKKSSQVQQQELARKLKYDKIARQRRQQKIRSIRENQVLLALNRFSLANPVIAEETYSSTIDIAALYDSDYEKYREKFSESISQNMRKLYCDFFNTHSLEDKSKKINKTFQKQLDNLSPTTIFNWFIQWSKKLYYEAIQDQINHSFINNDNKCIKNNENIMKCNRREFQSPLNIGYQRNQEITPIHQIAQTQIFTTSITSKHAILGFFVDQLNNYYKLNSIIQPDFNYIKTVRKRNKKQQLLKASNLNKAAQIIIDTTPNKLISSIMNDYLRECRQKFPNKLSPQKKVGHKNIYAEPQRQVAGLLSPLKKKGRINTEKEGGDESPKSKLLSPKMSEFEFIRPQELQMRIKKLKLINSQTAGNSLKFPEISKSKERISKNFSAFNRSPTFHKKKVMESGQNRKKFNNSLIQKNQVSEKQFLICQGLHNKSKMMLGIGELYGEIKRPRKASNNHSYEFSNKKYLKNSKVEMQIQYSDDKMKVSKNFEISSLVKNKKSFLIKNLFINDPMEA